MLKSGSKFVRRDFTILLGSTWEDSGPTQPSFFLSLLFVTKHVYGGNKVLVQFPMYFKMTENTLRYLPIFLNEDTVIKFPAYHFNLVITNHFRRYLKPHLHFLFMNIECR